MTIDKKTARPKHPGPFPKNRIIREGHSRPMTIDDKVSRLRVDVLLILAGLFVWALAMSFGCASPSSPSAVNVPVNSQPTVTPVAVTPVTPPVAAPPASASDPQSPNCTELDPKKWFGFTYRVQLRFVQMWNASSCDRVVTWRAFNLISEGNQPALGDAVITTVLAGKMDHRIDVHFYGWEPPCGSTVQTDGRSGSVSNMTHANASFPPGVLFTIPPCVPRVPPPPPPPPPPVCTDPAFGPWTTVIAPANNCRTERRQRTTCSGAIELEFREVCG